MRKLFQRARGRDNFSELHERYRRCRIDLNGAIVYNKREGYCQMCADVDENPCRTGYKMVMRKLNCFRPPATTYAAKLQSIIVWSTEKIPEASWQKLESVYREMKINKKPGIDGIPNIGLTATIESNTELFGQPFDICFQKRMLPRIVKRQRLFLIPKGNNAKYASGYRPLCIINTVGKFLKRIISKRQETYLGEEGLSITNLIFLEARSTIDAIEIVIAIAKDAISDERWLEGDN